MKMKQLDAIISDCIFDIKDAVADTNKMVLTKRDKNKLQALRKKINHMQRELTEIETVVLTRLYYAIGGDDANKRRIIEQTGDRLAGLSKE